MHKLKVILILEDTERPRGEWLAQKSEYDLDAMYDTKLFEVLKFSLGEILIVRVEQQLFGFLEDAFNLARVPMLRKLDYKKAVADRQDAMAKMSRKEKDNENS